MNEKESCATCKYNVEIQKWDYNHVPGRGVPKTVLEGHGCLAFLNEGLVVQLVGIDPDDGICECYTRKEKVKC